MHRMLEVTPIPVLADNYTWLLHAKQSGAAYVVDPGESAPVAQAIEQAGLTLEGILLTHRHHDHIGGVEGLARSGLPVFGPDHPQLSAVTQPLTHGDTLTLSGLDAKFQVMAVPGHTLEHIAFYGEGLLFAGDALFAGGCGRMFEGSAEQMQGYLAMLRTLPDETQLFCGHEYTLANLQFAHVVEPDNQALADRLNRVRRQRDQGNITLPSTLGEEKATNPFLRWDSPQVIEQASQQAGQSLHDPAEVFAALRRWKDHF